MQWFKHDTDASQDSKIRKLVMRHGAEGYAIYFHCLELIAGDVSESNITFELEHDAEIIADNLKIKGTAEESAIDRVNTIMRYIVDLGLFEESHGRIFCFKLLKRMDTSMTSSKRFRALITKAKEHNHDYIMISHDNIMQEENRIDKTRTDKKRIEEKRSEKDTALNESKKQNRFIPPTEEEVREYCKQRNNGIDPIAFIAHYQSKGWMVGKNKMKDWRAAVITWERRDSKNKPTPVITPEEKAKREAQRQREEEKAEREKERQKTVEYIEDLKRTYIKNPKMLELAKQMEEKLAKESSA